MGISDLISCEDLERLMPVFEKFDPVWSQFLQKQIARGRHYPKEAGCGLRSREYHRRNQTFFALSN
jgi:hypothetical protein